MESPRFPTNISRGVSFGPEFSTTITSTVSGHEFRNKNRKRAICKGDCAHAVKTLPQFKELLNYFRSVGGRFSGFRFKDWSDYTLEDSNSALRLIPNTVNQYQTIKKYSSASGFEELRDIRKPVASTYVLKDGGNVVSPGVGVGQYSIDYSTGILTQVSSQAKNVTGHAVGADHVFTYTGGTFSPLPLAGEYIAIIGATGAGANLVNNKLHLVKGVSTATTVTVDTPTSGTITAGTLFLYRQIPSLTVSCEFDVPCRFDTDFMPATMDHLEVFTWGQIPITEYIV